MSSPVCQTCLIDLYRKMTEHFRPELFDDSVEVININVRNFKFPIGFYSNPHPLWTPKNMALTPFTTNLSCSSWDLPWTSSWCTERKENKNKNKNNNNNNNNKRSKNNKSPKLCLGDLIINNHHKILLSKLVFIFVKFEGVSDCCLTSIASEQFFSYIIFR